jgi:hypothetical protein
MTKNEPDAVTWQRLFASLVGNAAVDARPAIVVMR